MNRDDVMDQTDTVDHGDVMYQTETDVPGAMTQTEGQKLKLLLPATPVERIPETKYTLNCHTQWCVYTTHITMLICQAR